ncbi:MAG: phospholipase D family protein [Candidatus Thermoplasmatota archaeon]|nr:phospholipase D family protein [Candidatus Thermoplasmatota archaeon]
MERIPVKKKYYSLFNSLLKKVSSEQSIEIDYLTKILEGEGYVKEMIYESIYFLISQDFFEIVESKKKFGKIKIKLRCQPEIYLETEEIPAAYPKLILNLPPYNVFGMQSELKQADVKYFNMKEEFRKLFLDAKKSIYICSPFLQLSGFKDFINILSSKAKEGVDIKIVARQIDKNDHENRYRDIKEIYQRFREKNANVEIRNYHYQKTGLESSTHAKLIVCDHKYAYIGSGEFRGPSFEKNLEMGLVVEGEIADQIGIIFEKLFSVSREVKFE